MAILKQRFQVAERYKFWRKTACFIQVDLVVWLLMNLRLLTQRARIIACRTNSSSHNFTHDCALTEISHFNKLSEISFLQI